MNNCAQLGIDEGERILFLQMVLYTCVLIILGATTGKTRQAYFSIVIVLKHACLYLAKVCIGDNK